MRCTTREVVAGLLVAAGLVLVAGCADPAATTDASSVAQTFVGAVLAGDGASACALLADPAVERLSADAGQPCEHAVLGDEVVASLTSGGGGADGVGMGGTGSGDAAHVAGGQAQVRRDGVVLFLASSGSGWKVTAAGCVPRDGRPYDCAIDGG